MADDFAGLADAHDLHAKARPVTGVQLHRVQPKDRVQLLHLR